MSVHDSFEKEFDKQLKSFSKVNIMVVGGTGVGKSSLINKVFGKELAKTGSGEPITKGIISYTYEGFPAVIYDTEGYEIINGSVDNSNFNNNVLREIKRLKEKELKDQIHLFWYCISATGHRITNYDLNNIKELNSLGVDLAVVITQCDNEPIDDSGNGLTSAAFKNQLLKESIDSRVFETVSLGDDTLQLSDLLTWSSERLTDDDLRSAFIGAQKLNIDLKNKSADIAIGLAVASASAAAGANPFPLSDSLMLMPIQMTLALRIANIYGFTSLGESATALLKTQVISLLGKQLATSLTKFIPIFGQIVNGAVAGSLTLALGYGLKTAYKNAYVDYLETGKEPEWVKLFSKLDIVSLYNQYKTK